MLLLATSMPLALLLGSPPRAPPRCAPVVAIEPITTTTAVAFAAGLLPGGAVAVQQSNKASKLEGTVKQQGEEIEAYKEKESKLEMRLRKLQEAEQDRTEVKAEYEEAITQLKAEYGDMTDKFELQQNSIATKDAMVASAQGEAKTVKAQLEYVTGENAKLRDRVAELDPPPEKPPKEVPAPYEYNAKSTDLSLGVRGRQFSPRKVRKPPAKPKPAAARPTAAETPTEDEEPTTALQAKISSAAAAKLAADKKRAMAAAEKAQAMAEKKRADAELAAKKKWLASQEQAVYGGAASKTAVASTGEKEWWEFWKRNE